LPKMVRELLGTDYVRITVADGHVHLRPVVDPAASLRKYAAGRVPFEEAREKAWEEVVSEKHPRR